MVYQEFPFPLPLESARMRALEQLKLYIYEGRLRRIGEKEVMK